MNPKPVATGLEISYTRTHTHRLGRFGGSGGVKRPALATLSQEIFDICIKLLTLDRRRTLGTIRSLPSWLG
jgi:hypothetical protein